MTARKNPDRPLRTYYRKSVVDPEDYSHPESDVRAAP